MLYHFGILTAYEGVDVVEHLRSDAPLRLERQSDCTAEGHLLTSPFLEGLKHIEGCVLKEVHHIVRQDGVVYLLIVLGHLEQ